MYKGAQLCIKRSCQCSESKSLSSDPSLPSMKIRNFKMSFLFQHAGHLISCVFCTSWTVIRAQLISVLICLNLFPFVPLTLSMNLSTLSMSQFASLRTWEDTTSHALLKLDHHKFWHSLWSKKWRFIIGPSYASSCQMLSFHFHSRCPFRRI